MIYISASTIKDMLICSYKRHHALYNKDKIEKTPQIIVGEIVHDSIKKYPKDPENGANYIRKTAKWYNLTDNYETYSQMCLTGYFKKFYPLLPVYLISLEVLKRNLRVDRRRSLVVGRGL